MIVTERNEGRKLEYAVNGTVLTLDGGRITLDLQKYQCDYPVTLDFVTDGEGNVMVNAFDSLRAYVAEVRLPAYETVEVDAEADVEAAAGDEDTAETVEDTTPTDGVVAAEAGRVERRVRRLPLDMEKVALDLFSVAGLYVNQLDSEY